MASSGSSPSGGSFQTRIGKYELGKLVGQGSFAKVRRARNVETDEIVAIKVLDKEMVMKNKMVEQLKREISTMKLVKHPNIVQLYEVLASKTKVYIVLEYVTGGELFDKIKNLQIKQTRLKEDEARKYFQQLINAVDYCHSRGVCHRDLKPENLLLDKKGNLKISDFGLSALPQHNRPDGLLHTTCGTPNYVAPEVIKNKGYNGAIADLWSCGVILFVLISGYLPFDDTNLMNLYKMIFRAEVKCPNWFSTGAKELVCKLLQPNPKHRITIPKILEDKWFKVDYKPAKFLEEDVVHLKDVEDVFNEEHLVKEEKGMLKRQESKPVLMNAFELLSMSSGLDLSGLFEKQKEPVKRESRFASVCPANQIISKIEETARPLGFDVRKHDYKMKLLGSKSGRKGHLSVATEVFEVAPSLFMVEMRKAGGDTLEYSAFHKDLYVGLKDIVWKNELEV